MKADEQIVGEAIRIEFDENSGKLYIVFEISNEKQKQNIMKTWADDIEYKLIGKLLIKNE
tara:strand:- start:112 stop:291 length:180 start_codon:yes stop_codon:yes gene_type:complete